MKLFQRLLVAPAALGLLSPLSSSATEVNLNDISTYSDEGIEVNLKSFDNFSTTNDLLAGGEGMIDDHDGSFSETTTASFSADFAIGAVEGLGISTASPTDGDEEIQAGYGFQIDLNTSFTGEDSLDISIDAGNASGSAAIAEFDLNGDAGGGAGKDGLTVDGVSYTFPLGDKTTVIVGDNTDGSALFTTACAYGGPSNTMDDCANVNAGITNGGAMIGASYEIGGGLTAAVGYAGDETSIGTKEGVDAYGANVAYTADSYGVSVTYGVKERGTTEDSYTALNAYWTPEGFPSVSVGYEVGSLGDKAATADETLAYFVGLEWAEVGPGTLGFAAGTAGAMTEAGTGNNSSSITEEMMYEAYYSYPVNDGMTITPLIFSKEKATAGTPDQTGIMVKTSFSF